MKWYKRDPDAERLATLRRMHGPNCCGEYPAYEHIRHYVYILRNEQQQINKIGICRELPARIKAIQTTCPYPLDLFWSASVPSREIAREMEVTVLQRFPRLNGEWVSGRASDLVEVLEGVQ